MKIQTILLVDDEPDIRTIGELALATVRGWRVLLASHGDEALDLARRERPDLILLDVMMPGMDGPATCQALHNQPETREIPIVFMTARMQRSDVQEYLALGAVGVISKPFEPMTLAGELERIVEDIER